MCHSLLVSRVSRRVAEVQICLRLLWRNFWSEEYLLFSGFDLECSLPSYPLWNQQVLTILPLMVSFLLVIFLTIFKTRYICSEQQQCVYNEEVSYLFLFSRGRWRIACLTLTCMVLQDSPFPHSVKILFLPPGQVFINQIPFFFRKNDLNLIQFSLKKYNKNSLCCQI